MKFKKGDEILVTIGKDRGKKGKIETVLPKEQTVLVAGVNIYKRHLKPQGQNKTGGIVDKTIPLSVAKIALICPKCGKPTRVGWQTTQKDESKLRLCRKCDSVI